MRGQTFPLWIGNILLTLVFSAFIVSYGYLVSYQMRAQAVADSVAAGMVSIQAQQFNQMTAGLYASAVEEYRIRHLLEGYRLASMGAGGCDTQSPDCETTWLNLKKAYSQSIARFDQDVRYVNRVTSTMNFGSIQSDAKNFVALVNSTCNGNGPAQLTGKFVCGDRRAPMLITYVDMKKRTVPYSARRDATNLVLPSYFSGTPTNANLDVFAPVKAEVIACVNVPPFFTWIPGLANFRQNVWARGAAANALVEQDWFQPGLTANSLTGQFYQPQETYGPKDTSLPVNWYMVNYGGRTGSVAYDAATPKTSQITAAVRDEALIVKTGWWGPVPIFPYIGGNVSTGACPNAP